MKPAASEYSRPADIDEACALRALLGMECRDRPGLTGTGFSATVPQENLRECRP
jgi:hypothetical protein